MMRNMSRGIPRLFKEGYKQMTGLEEAILKNCEAATDLSATVQSAFGPYGLSKIVINRIEKVIITTDAAAILSELEVQHPAAKVLVLAAAMQQREIGDGANFVIIFAGELLKKALHLMRSGLHPADMVRGYRIAQKKAIEYLTSGVVYEVSREDMKNREKLMVGVKAAIGSKQHGHEEVLSSLVADACINSMPKSSARDFNVDNIRTVKILGDRIDKSFVIDGMVLERRPISNLQKLEGGGKVAIFTIAVDTLTTETTGNVLIHSAKELMEYNLSEEQHIEALIKGLYEMGVRVIISKESFGEMAMHFIDKMKMVAFRLTSKFTMRRLCRTMGARPIVRLTDVRPDDLGSVDKLYTKEVGGKIVSVFEADMVGKSPVSTIVLRGATNTVLDDAQRAIDDGVNVVRAMTRNGQFVAGGGAIELEMAMRLKQFARTVTGLEQYAIEAFGEALEVVPRTLAENSGLDDTEIISALYKAHSSGSSTSTSSGGSSSCSSTSSKGDSNSDVQSADDSKTSVGGSTEESGSSSGQNYGLNIETGDVKDMIKEGILDLMITRQMGVTLAAQAANTILKVDHIIMKKPAGGPKLGQKRGHWDDNDETW